jgi:hypothetical protein
MAKYRKITPKTFVRRFPDRRLNKVKISGTSLMVGNVYKGRYFPINSEKLSFYDREPLFLFMEARLNTKTILGINLHYLPIDWREQLMTKVWENRGDLFRYWRWERLAIKKEFRYIPVAFRVYKAIRMKNVELVFNSYSDEGIDRELLKMRKKTIIGGWTERDDRITVNVSMRNQMWEDYVKEKYNEKKL